MDFSVLVTGGLFIVLGFLVKAFPILMAGYNTMSEEEKKNVDIEKLGAFARNCMLGIGIVLIAAESAVRYFHLVDNMNYVIIPIVVTGVVILIVGAQKYDHN